MAVRIPQSLSTGLQPETGWSVLDYELRQQKAHTLGTLSGQVEQALAALRAFDAGAHQPDRDHRRRALLDDAADLIWDAVVKDYGIPREVLNPGRAGQAQG